jgi:hypothetical protein
MSKEQIYKNIDSLKPVENLVTEANSAISDPSRTFSYSSEINQAMAAAAGIGVGGGIGFAALYFGGSVAGLSAAGISSGLAVAGSLIGGGMAAGIAVLAAPAAFLGIVGYAVAANRNKKKLLQKKESLLQEVLRKHNAIIIELSNTSQSNKERIEYLTRLNTLLQAAVSDLTNDLAEETYAA